MFRAGYLRSIIAISINGLKRTDNLIGTELRLLGIKLWSALNSTVNTQAGIDALDGCI